MKELQASSQVHTTFSATLTDHIRQLLTDKPELKDKTIQVKLSGDGAQMSRTTNFMMMSFALLELNKNVMSSKRNRTIAIINGPEEYETSLWPIFLKK